MHVAKFYVIGDYLHFALLRSNIDCDVNY